MFKRAFLIDNDAVFRLGLSQVLADEFAIATVGAHDLAHDHTETVRETEADLLILSLVAADPAPPVWLPRLLSRPREFLVAMLIPQQSAAAVRELVAIGADGFLLKPVGVTELSSLIATLRRNYGDEGVPVFGGPIPAEQPRSNKAGSLSDREVLVIKRTADGRSSAQIAAEFGISIKTAERYRRSIFSKLGLHSVAELTKFAVREGYTAL